MVLASVVLGSAADVPMGRPIRWPVMAAWAMPAVEVPIRTSTSRVVLPNQAGQTLLHIGADLHIRQGQPVVTVHRAFDAGSPGKGWSGRKKTA